MSICVRSVSIGVHRCPSAFARCASAFARCPSAFARLRSVCKPRRGDIIIAPEGRHHNSPVGATSQTSSEIAPRPEGHPSSEGNHIISKAQWSLYSQHLQVLLQREIPFRNSSKFRLLRLHLFLRDEQLQVWKQRLL